MESEPQTRIRLVAFLSAAVLLAGALVYTTFAGASQAMTPSQLLSVAPPASMSSRAWSSAARSVAPATTSPSGCATAGAAPPCPSATRARYPIREGREIIVTVHASGRAFTGEPGSLITKCPSKFAAKRT